MHEFGALWLAMTQVFRTLLLRRHKVGPCCLASVSAKDLPISDSLLGLVDVARPKWMPTARETSLRATHGDS